jgi:hypothetical protein
MPDVRRDEIPLTLVIICHDPPPPARNSKAMAFGAQDKAAALHPGQAEPDGSLRFLLAVRARPAASGSVDFAGSCVHGGPQGRFLYLGYRPVDATVWERRWKIPLAAITLTQVAAAHARGQALQASMRATSGSTAQLLGVGWTLVATDDPARN